MVTSMLVDLTSEQDFFRETTAKFLETQVPVDAIRRLRNDPVGYGEDYWRRGGELGWTSLLVSEDHGGGTISGAGLLDLTLIAHEFGRHAAPGPLVSTNVVAAALSEAGTPEQTKLLEDVLTGDSIVTWCFGERATTGSPGDLALSIEVEGGELVLNGVKRPVESGGQADYLLVTGSSGAGLTQALIPAGTAGVSVKAMQSVDITPPFLSRHLHRRTGAGERRARQCRRGCGAGRTSAPDRLRSP